MSNRPGSHVLTGANSVALGIRSPPQIVSVSVDPVYPHHDRTVRDSTFSGLDRISKFKCVWVVKRDNRIRPNAADSIPVQPIGDSRTMLGQKEPVQFSMSARTCSKCFSVNHAFTDCKNQYR